VKYAHHRSLDSTRISLERIDNVISHVVHAGVGKASFNEEQLIENVKAFVDAVAKAKPAGAKGAYMKGITLSSTMGPGVTISIDKANAQ
jgi:large subunit ribosomal protein L1